MCDLESIMIMPKRVKFGNLKVGDRLLRGRRNKIRYKTVAKIEMTRNSRCTFRPMKVIFTDGDSLRLWMNTDVFITRIRGEISEDTFTKSMTSEVLPYLEYAYQALRCLQSTEIPSATESKHVEDIRKLGCMIDRFRKRVDKDIEELNGMGRCI